MQLTLRRQASPIQGRHHGIFAIGRNGFSVKWSSSSRSSRAHFVPGAAFSMVDGPQLLADGEVLGQNEVHEPGQG